MSQKKIKIFAYIAGDEQDEDIIRRLGQKMHDSQGLGGGTHQEHPRNSADSEEEGIDIKRATDDLSLPQLETLLIREIYRGRAEAELELRLNSQLDSFAIGEDAGAEGNTEINEPLFLPPENTLKRRRRGEHLTFSEKSLIYKLHRTHDVSLSRI